MSMTAFRTKMNRPRVKTVIGIQADADIVVWEPKASRTISVDTQHMSCDFSLFEGMEVTGIARATVSRGKLVWDGSELMAEEGEGRYVDRPAFSAVFDSVKRLQAFQAPKRKYVGAGS